MLQHITFTNENMKFDLRLKSHLTLVLGEVGIGKTFFYHSYRNEIIAEGKENDVLFFNNDYESQTETVYSLIKKSKDKLIIIDNSELLLDKSMKRYISRDKNNQYLIITHTLNGYILRRDSAANMVLKGNTLCLEYVY